MRRTIFRSPSNAEHVQGCELAVIEMATADSYASGTATGSVFLGKMRNEAAKLRIRRSKYSRLHRR